MRTNNGSVSATAFAFGLAIVFSLIAPALAESSPTPMATLLPADGMSASPAPNRVGEVPLAMSVVTYRAVAYGERGSKIIGATVYNEKKQAIGKVADLVINPHDFVSIIVVSVGGFLGLDAKDVAVSAQNFQFSGNRVILPRATKQVLQQLPAFHFDR